MKGLNYNWFGHIPKEMCQELIDSVEAHSTLTTGILGEEGTTDPKMRKANIAWLKQEETPGVFEVIGALVSHANQEVYGLDIQGVQDAQYTVYDSEELGHYDWHMDIVPSKDSNSVEDRKITVVVQLSDPDSYEGGDLEFIGTGGTIDKRKSRSRGTVFSFPSFLTHRVTPVTKGVRRSLVLWYTGPNLK
jgi:PKHD-type hydroxylase